MNTKLLLTWATLALLFTACEEEEQAPPPRTYPVNVYAGMPGVYGNADSGGEVLHPISDVTIKIYQTPEDYLLDQNTIAEGLTDTEGKFTFEYDSIGSLWFSSHKDTLSNIRGVTSNNEFGGVAHNEILITGTNEFQNYGAVFATLTNLPTKLRLSVFHEGQAVEGAQVQLYFTEQAYQDSLAAQQDSVHLRPTYGYRRIGASDSESAFTNRNKDYFLQTTDESGEVYFDNLEPRNYWFRITKDTLSNEGTVIRTREALPRNADITTQMEVGVE